MIEAGASVFHVWRPRPLQPCPFLVVFSAAAVAATAAAMLIATAVFGCGAVIGFSYVALAVTGLIGVKGIEGLRAAFRHWAVITVVRIVAIVHVAVEAVGAVKPGAGAEEDSANKPVRPVVTVGSAVVGGIVEVAVGANRCGPDIDGDLGGRH